MSDFESEVIRRLVGIEDAVQSANRRIDIMDESIRGNGKPGINQRMARSETLIWFAIIIASGAAFGVLANVLYVLSRL